MGEIVKIIVSRCPYSKHLEMRSHKDNYGFVWVMGLSTKQARSFSNSSLRKTNTFMITTKGQPQFLPNNLTKNLERTRCDRLCADVRAE